jgi:hypothetical protein
MNKGFDFGVNGRRGGKFHPQTGSTSALRHLYRGAEVAAEVADGVVSRPRSNAGMTAAELLENPEALLTRSHLRELGLERRAVDAVFRAVPVVALPGYSRPLIRVRDYRLLLERSTFDGRTKVRT